ncbi:hypothetical protein GC197_09040 [bacterium]|nr:hypothetical protein [bacterium]
MPGGIDGLGFNQPQTSNLNDGQTLGDSVSVQSHGQTVEAKPKDISSIVADAQEESTMMMQDKSSDKLGKREARSKSASRIRELTQKYLKQVGGVQDQSEKFQKFAKFLKDLGKATPQQIRDMLDQIKGESDDETFESAMLLALEELFVSEGNSPELVASIREVKSALGEELRNFYQEHVKTYEDVSEVYQKLLGEFGDEDFMKATDMLITRLGSDLQSQGNTADSNRIKATVDSLYHLEVARNTYSAFAGLIDRMNVVFGIHGN